MRWLKRDKWKADIAIAGMLLLLVLMVWVPVSAAGTQERASGLATPTTGTVQVTPTMQATPIIDPTIVAATAKEQLRKLERDNDRGFQAWFWSSSATFLSTLVLVGGALIGFWQWRVNRKDTLKKQLEDQRTTQEKELNDREAEREKLAEERFQKVVEELASDKKEVKATAAIVLRTFLGSRYEQFYEQVFDLVVAHLRLPRTSHPLEDSGGISHSPVDSNTPLPSIILSQALIVVFKEAFSRARDVLKNRDGQFRPGSLDATGVQLDDAYLNDADLRQVWMPQASLRKATLNNARLRRAILSNADLSGANLSGADLSEADLSRSKLVEAKLDGAKLGMAKLSRADLRGANLHGTMFSNADLHKAVLSGTNLYEANLSGANLSSADLSGADLHEAKLSRADLRGDNLHGTVFSNANLHKAVLSRTNLREANLSGANLSSADLRGADLYEADLSRADLREANLSGADLSRANLDGARLFRADLSGVHLDNALSLKGTNLYDVKGLTTGQLETCRANGAIIDEDAATSSFRSIFSPSLLSQSNNVQSPSAKPAQESPPTSDTGGRSAAHSSKPSPES